MTERYPEPISRHQIGEVVVLDFGKCGKLHSCKVAGVKFTDYGKVLYDISLHPYGEEPDEYNNHLIVNTLRDIDSCRVKDPIEDALSIKNEDYEPGK